MDQWLAIKFHSQVTLALTSSLVFVVEEKMKESGVVSTLTHPSSHPIFENVPTFLFGHLPDKAEWPYSCIVS